MRISTEKPVERSISEARRFRLDCFPFIFSIEELEILEKKGHKMQELFDGKKDPDSQEEKSFVRFCKGRSGPSTTMEIAWIKYLHRHELEASLLQTDELYREYTRSRRH